MTDSKETQPLTHNQAQIIAAAWHEVRPEWGIPSLMTLLGLNADRAPFGQLLRAGLNVALDNPKAKTPAVIFLDGKHWLTAEQAADPARTSWFGNDSSEDCPNHPTVKAWDCKACRRADPMPANFRDRVAAEAEKVRAAKAAKLTTTTTTTTTEDVA